MTVLNVLKNSAPKWGEVHSTENMFFIIRIISNSVTCLLSIRENFVKNVSSCVQYLASSLARMLPKSETVCFVGQNMILCAEKLEPLIVRSSQSLPEENFLTQIPELETSRRRHGRLFNWMSAKQSFNKCHWSVVKREITDVMCKRF
jgi:hypothetical protein